MPASRRPDPELDRRLRGGTIQSDAEVARAGRGVATGGLIASVAVFLSATCCVLPMIVVTAGLGGAWVALLGTLFDYRYVFLTVSVLLVAFGWGVLYRRRATLQKACADGLCSSARTSRSALVVLSISTLFIAGAGLVMVYQDALTRWVMLNRSLFS